MELSITQISGEDKPVELANVRDYGECYQLARRGIDIASDGTYTQYTYGFIGNNRFGKFDPETLTRIRALAGALPPDENRLPPPGRRLVVRSSSFGTRVYDRAHLSDGLIEIIQLTNPLVEVIQPVFLADAKLAADELSPVVTPCHQNATVSPDGRLGVANDFTTAYLSVYRGSNWCGTGWPRDGTLIRVIPETWPSKHYGDVAVTTEFTPDGRYLLAKWGPNGVVLFDTATWQIVNDPNIFPANLRNYTHSPDWKIVIGWPLQTRPTEPPPGMPYPAPTEAVVWDATTHSFLPPLPIYGFLQWNNHSFSPDDRLLAFMSSASNRSEGISVWDLRQGTRLRTYLPALGTAVQGEPLWWNAGQWLLARVYGNGHEGEAIWEAATGRFLGTALLSDECHANVKATIVEDRLRIACGPQYAMQWTVDGVQAQIAAWADDRLP